MRSARSPAACIGMAAASLLPNGCNVVDYAHPTEVCGDAQYTPPTERSGSYDVALHVVLDGAPRGLEGRSAAEIFVGRQGPPGFTLHATAPDFDQSLVAEAGEHPGVDLMLEPLITAVPLDLTVELEIDDDATDAAPVTLAAGVCATGVSEQTPTTIELTFEAPP